MGAVLLTIAGLIILPLVILLFTPFYLEGDTRVPVLRVRLPPLGEGELFFRGQWNFRFRILVFSKTINLEERKPAVVTREDQITFISTQSSKGLGAAFEKVPDLIEKLMATKNGKKAKKEEEVA